MARAGSSTLVSIPLAVASKRLFDEEVEGVNGCGKWVRLASEDYTHGVINGDSLAFANVSSQLSVGVESQPRRLQKMSYAGIFKVWGILRHFVYFKKILHEVCHILYSCVKQNWLCLRCKHKCSCLGFDNCLAVDHQGRQVVYLCSGSERLMFLCIPIICTILMPLFG